MTKNFRELEPGMGLAVAKRTILRKKADGEYETWGDVADRVALGNTLLVKGAEADREALRRHIANGTVLMSGRHLQHGDENQPNRNGEIMTNCATAATSFVLFYLLLNGSGVGRCYDDDFILINWDNAPNLRCVLDETHPDFNFSAHESVRDAKHKYGTGRDTIWFTVPDSREGWAKALELWENATFEKIHKDKLLILDFSEVRPKGSPIGGMQNRPASGPVPLMNAFLKAASIKGSVIEPWKQAMYVDHYFAECVLVGGARRSARMSTKTWRDPSVIDFIQVKRPIEYTGMSAEKVQEFQVEYLKKNGCFPYGFLWSSNNSVTADGEFWELLALKRTDEEYKNPLAMHARKVFKVLTECSYGDGTGEPGIINQHKLVQNDAGWTDLNRGDFIGSNKLAVNEDTQILLSRLAKRAKKKKYHQITNPCVIGSTLILTESGYVPIKDCVGKLTKIWNGYEWSQVKPFSTGVNEIVRVEFSDGSSLHCTPRHKFILHGDRYHREGKRVEAKQLQVGDSLAKFTMPVVEVGEVWNVDAYSQGFYSGDGLTAHNHSLLYDTKYCCEERLTGTFGTVGINRKRWMHGEMLPKDFVPITGSKDYCLNWFAGLVDSDGTVCRDKNGNSIQITSIDKEFLINVRLMLTRLGVSAKVVRGHPERTKNIKGKMYDCQSTYRLLVNSTDTYHLIQIGFNTERVKVEPKQPQRDARQFVRVVSIEPLASEETFCFTDLKNNSGTFNGIVTANCGEISLNILAGYCVIADVVPFHADSLDDAENAIRHTTRALIRTNQMNFLYGKEVERTNRIGVSLTGVHEFAWKFFGYGFRDLIDEEKSKDFWMTIARFNRAVIDEARKYCAELGVNMPHTLTTIKPAGTTSKLFGLTEGWHLPSMAFFLRWVQFRDDDPLIEQYRANGYPVRVLQQYQGTVIVGFPTAPTISQLGMGDKLVTAGEASPDEQYQWLKLGEKYWITGVDEEGTPHEFDLGNQISYTLKYKPENTSLGEFRRMMMEHQSHIKCCSVMPQIEMVAFEYQPEEPISKAEYEQISRSIKVSLKEDVDKVHIDCAGGACPVDFNDSKEVS